MRLHISKFLTAAGDYKLITNGLNLLFLFFPHLSTPRPHPTASKKKIVAGSFGMAAGRSHSHCWLSCARVDETGEGPSDLQGRGNASSLGGRCGPFRLQERSDASSLWERDDSSCLGRETTVWLMGEMPVVRIMGEK